MTKNCLIVSKIKIAVLLFSVQHSVKTYSWLFTEQTADMDA